MWRCRRCKSEFEEPYYKDVTENLDGENGWWHHVDLLCPFCGEDCIEEMEEEE